MLKRKKKGAAPFYDGRTKARGTSPKLQMGFGGETTSRLLAKKEGG